MLLQSILDLFPDTVAEVDAIAYLQRGYEYAVKKLRLFPSLHPVVLNSIQRMEFDGFDNLHTISTSGSEIAVKRIVSVLFADTIDELADTKYTAGVASFGDFMETDFGFTGFSTVNSNQGTIPEVYITGTSLIVPNLTTSYFCLVCDIYPYPVYVVDDWYTTEYRYDIAWMITEYDIENLYVDDLLGLLSFFQAISFYFGEQKDINLENAFNKFMLDIINIHNANSAKLPDNYMTVGTVEGGSIE